MCRYMVTLFISFCPYFCMFEGIFFCMNWAVPNSLMFMFAAIFCRLVLTIGSSSDFANTHIFLKSLTQITYKF